MAKSDTELKWATGISAAFNVLQAVEAGSLRAEVAQITKARDAEHFARIMADARAAKERELREFAEATLRTTRNDLANAKATAAYAQFQRDQVTAERDAVRRERDAARVESAASRTRAEVAEARVRELEAALATRPDAGPRNDD